MWLTVEDVADRYGVPLRTVYDWRLRNYGPRAVKIGRHLRYHLDDVVTFEQRLRDANADA
jgi:excisionase family DNA binding protein